MRLIREDMEKKINAINANRQKRFDRILASI